MKVNLHKKRAITATILLTMCCYGHVWAETIDIYNDITIGAGKLDTIGTDNQNEYGSVSIREGCKNIKIGDGATLNIRSTGTLMFYGDKNIEGKGTLNIDNSSYISSSGSQKPVTWLGNSMGNMSNININASKVHIKTDNCVVLGNVNINQSPAYKNAITQIESALDLAGSEINFNGKNSYLKGLTNETVYYYDKKSKLTFNNGANWIVSGYTAHSTGSAVSRARKWSTVYDLNLLNKSVMDLNTETTDEVNTAGRNVVAVSGTFNGNGGIIKMGFDGGTENDILNRTELTYYTNWYNYKHNLIYANKHEGETTLLLKNLSDDITYLKDHVVARVTEEKGTFKGGREEGAISWIQYNLKAKKYDEILGLQDKDKENNQEADYTYWVIDSFSHETAPTTSTKTLLSTITAGYDTWRNDTDKFNERMGELRMNGVGNDGVWVRTKGSEFGRHSSNGSYTNKQQTYQLGYDTVTSKDEKQTTYTGVAAEYGKGSLTFDSGTGTMKSMGLGVYQSQLRESGHYLDLTYRFDKYKNDFHVADSMGDTISGKYGNNAMSLSAEYGRKNALKHGWYVEPQSEVTLGYMFGNDFTTSNNIRVEQKNMPALIGRLGLNIGREVSDKVNFYVKASVNHDFLGNYDMHMTDMSRGERLNASDKFGSSWFDYGAGLSVKTGKDSYAYFDIERAVGGEYKKNWDWNAGVRWSF